MAEVAIEDAIYDFLEETIAAINEAEAEFDELTEHSPLFGAQLLDSPYETITKDYGIQIDDGESDLAPSSGAETVEEFDGNVTLIIFRKVPKVDRAHRKAARSQAMALALATAKLFFDDPTMGNRVNDARVLRCLRGWANIKSSPYVILNVPLLVNETGAGG